MAPKQPLTESNSVRQSSRAAEQAAVAEPSVLCGSPPDLEPAASRRIDALFASIPRSSPAEFLIVERLRQLTARLEKSASTEPKGSGDPAWHRYEAQADRSFRAILAMWIRVQALSARSEKPATQSRRRANTRPVSQANADPTHGSGPAVSTPDTEPRLPENTNPASPDVLEPPCPDDWRDHLVIDPQISPDWPVVKGTRLWADHVASMLEDGWNLSKILHNYPALKPEDVAACRYADSIRLCGPWPHGQPPVPRSRSLFPDDPTDPWPPRAPA